MLAAWVPSVVGVLDRSGYTRREGRAQTVRQLSILIPTYNDAAQLPATLSPLLSDPATGEVLVIVDGSRDGSYELLADQARRDERVRPFWIENRGQAGARQYGLERARHDVVLMLDADVVARDGLVSAHAKWHEEGTNRLVIGYMPPVVPPRRPGSFVIERYAHQYELACHGYERDPADRFGRLWMGNVSVGREALLAAGGFDAGAGLRYCDDNELGLRLAAANPDLEPVFDRGLLAEHRFERTVSGFLSTSRTFGRDLVRLERLHPGQARFPAWRASRSGAILSALVTRRRSYAWSRRAGVVSLACAGRAGRWTLERRLGALLDRLEVQRGIEAEQRARPGR
jgi:glycosyltransferase involved in cell wall biosynthesis